MQLLDTMSALFSGKSSMSGAFPSGGMQQLTAPRYENVQEIGKGAYSAVYKGRDRLTEGRYVAMKEVRVTLNSEEGIPMTTVREIGLLRQLDKFEHPNVVRYCQSIALYGISLSALQPCCQSRYWATSLFGLVFRSVFSLSPKFGLSES